MERSTMFNGKIHYFDWAIFNSYVKLPEDISMGLMEWDYLQWILNGILNGIIIY